MDETWVFFYGSFMDPGILMERGVNIKQFVVSKLNGFQLRFQPLANLIKFEQDSVHGLAYYLPNEEIRMLYEKPIDGVHYYPIPVEILDAEDQKILALCYITKPMPKQKPTDAYLQIISKIYKLYEFPTKSIDH
jgi:cation transport regulator ChaC